MNAWHRRPPRMLMNSLRLVLVLALLAPLTQELGRTAEPAAPSTASPSAGEHTRNERPPRLSHDKVHQPDAPQARPVNGVAASKQKGAPRDAAAGLANANLRATAGLTPIAMPAAKQITGASPTTTPALTLETKFVPRPVFQPPKPVVPSSGSAANPVSLGGPSLVGSKRAVALSGNAVRPRP